MMSSRSSQKALLDVLWSLWRKELSSLAGARGSQGRELPTPPAVPSFAAGDISHAVAGCWGLASPSSWTWEDQRSLQCPSPPSVPVVLGQAPRNPAIPHRDVASASRPDSVPACHLWEEYSLRPLTFVCRSGGAGHARSAEDVLQAQQTCSHAAMQCLARLLSHCPHEHCSLRMTKRGHWWWREDLPHAGTITLAKFGNWRCRRLSFVFSTEAEKDLL